MVVVIVVVVVLFVNSAALSCSAREHVSATTKPRSNLDRPTLIIPILIAVPFVFSLAIDREISCNFVCPQPCINSGRAIPIRRPALDSDNRQRLLLKNISIRKRGYPRKLAACGLCLPEPKNPSLNAQSDQTSRRLRVRFTCPEKLRYHSVKRAELKLDGFREVI